jgi:signal transduction protein with GAF and PtsI domain
MIDTAHLESSLRDRLDGDGDLDARLQMSIEEIARIFEARTCTLHQAAVAGDFLHLRAQVGLPPHIAEITRTIPVGKGMAGICAERKEPVTVCNLQTDDSGVVRPAAKDTRVAGALVVPVLEGDRVLATLGVGKPADHDYADDEIRALELCGRMLANVLTN